MTAMHPSLAAEPAAARFALVAVDGVEYAVDATWVRRSLPAPHPLPATIAHAAAAFQVIDLRQLFGLPAAAGARLPAAAAAAECGPERLILLVEQPPVEHEAGNAVNRAALVVDDLLGIEPLAAGTPAPLPAVYRGPERRWFRGLVPGAGGKVTVLLRLEGLSAAAELGPPAPPGLPGGNGC
jgi:hypothetical protein